MYEDSSGGMEVTPDQLNQQANQIHRLGDDLRTQTSKEQLEPPKLGISPPAIWFAQKFSQLGGQRIAEEFLRWAAGLNSFADNAKASSQDYQAGEGQSAVSITEVYPE